MRIKPMWGVLAVLLVANEALAGEAILQNDSFSGSSTVNAGMSFNVDYEGAAVVLNADSYPQSLIAIEVLYVPLNSPAQQEQWMFDIYSMPDGGVTSASSPWGDLFSNDLEGTTVPFNTSTTQFNRFDLPSPVQMTGPVLVAVRQGYAASELGEYDGTIALDTSPDVLGANWFAFQPGDHPGYADMGDPDAGYPQGNWIIRGVISVAGTTTTTGSSSTTTSSTTGTTGTTSSVTTGTTSGTTTTSTSGTSSSTSTSTGTTTGTTSSSTTTGSTTGTSGTLTLTSVAPTSAFTDDDTQVTLVGSNFAIGVQALIGPTPLDDIQLRSPAVLVATLPHGTAPGTYDVTVINPDGAQASLSNAFTIEAGSGASGSGSTGSGGGSNGSAGASGGSTGTTGTKSGGCGCATNADVALFALPFALIALRRRRS